MKPRYFLTFFALVAVALLVDCNCKGKDPDPDKRIGLLNDLKGKWKAISVTLDNSSKVTEYANFFLTISGTDDQAIDKFDYKAEGRPNPSVWQADGKFSFVSGSESSIVLRNDDVKITYGVASANGTTALTLDFNFSAPAGGYAGRVGAVTGNWKFVLTKQ